MAWEENSRIRLHTQLIAILSRIGVELLLDNILAENELRPITLGRKNYMFCGNHEPVGNMCVIQSLLATCRNHDINPRLYLNSVIASMPCFDKATHGELVHLLPYRWK